MPLFCHRSVKEETNVKINSLSQMVKRKQKTRFFQRVKGVRVHLDDLEGILSEAAERGFHVTISDDEYVYDSLKEIIDRRGRRPRKLEFSFKSRDDEFAQIDITLSIEKDDASLHSGIGWRNEARVEAFGQWILRRAKNWVPWYHYPLLWQAWVLLLMIVSMAGLLLVENPEAPAPPWVLWALGVVGVGIMGSAGGRRVLLGMNLYRRHEANVWIRNKDRILTLAIGTAVGALLVLFFQQLF